MESSKAITKVLECRKHPGEKIQRVSSVDGPNVLYCIDCCLSIEDKQTKEAVIPIKEFIERSVSYFEKIKQQATLKGDIPLDLLAALDGEDELISKISSHIESEKVKVEISFGEIIQSFNTLCSKTKQEIISNLDNQLFNIKYNYRYYRNKVHKYYGKQTETEIAAFTTERGLVSAINQCDSASDLEFLIKQVNDEISENKFFDSFGDRVEGMSNVLKELKKALKDQGDTFPKTQFSDPTSSEKIIETFQKAMDTFVQEARFIENEIGQLSFNSTSIDSKIINCSTEVEMIKQWLPAKASALKFKLLLRGTRDGFDFDTFHKKCDNKKYTLVLVKTDHGKRCGGFTELEWNNTSNYKQHNKSFLFSLDHKTKFPIKQQQYSIYTNTGYLPTFGGGFDLYLANNCNTHSTNYSNFGHSYDAGKFAGNDVKNTLTGGYNFKVLEYEVFEVENYRNK